jgi:hypothetical protein
MTITGTLPRLLASLALLFSTSLSGGQAGAPTRTVSGQVVNSVTGQPIARALVQIGAQHGMLTDHEGRFAFDDLNDDAGAAFASRPGYFTLDGAPASTTQPLILPLVPEAIISGTVTDLMGHPIQDLHVELRVLQVRNGLRSWQQTQTTITSVEGEYRFAELRAGQYRVVTGLQAEGTPEAPSTAFVPAAYPPAEESEGNSALTIAAGDHSEANLTPSTEKLYPVTGVIRGPVNGSVVIEADGPDGEPLNTGGRIYPESGTFRLLLPSGTYRLNVHSFVQPGPLFGTREVVVGHAALEGVAISLTPQITVPVEVDYQVIDTGTNVEQTLPGPPFNFTLENADPAGPVRTLLAVPRRIPGTPQAPEPGGAYMVENVEPGRYDMLAQGAPPWYLASAACDNLDLMRNVLVISAGTGACTIRAVLRNDAANLHWSIAPTDVLKSGGSVFVSVIPLDNLTAAAQSGIFSSSPAGSSPQGTFTGLAPGRYLVIALPHQQELPYRDSEAMKTYLPLGQEITLSRNGQAEVQLQLAAGEP